MKADVHECVTFLGCIELNFSTDFEMPEKSKLKYKTVSWHLMVGTIYCAQMWNEFKEVQREMMQNLVFNIFLNILKASQHFGLTSI